MGVLVRPHRSVDIGLAYVSRVLGMPVVLMGFGLPDDNLHAPNEKLHLPNFYRGIETGIAFLPEFAASRKEGK